MIVAMQMCSGRDPNANLASLAEELEHLPEQRPLLVCLPESWLCFAGEPTEALAVAADSEYWIARIAELTRNYGVWLAAGTIPVTADNDKYYAASLLFNEQGEVVARYDKLHLFDVEVSDGTGRYRESATTMPGEHLSVVDTPFGRIGLSVCYDMRFSALYWAMREAGAEIILVPSAFTRPTGEAHWHVLLRARAIETQCYVVAAAQWGMHENGRETYGHSVIINPWGEIETELAEGTGQVACQTDFARLKQIRERMPVASHARFREFKL